MFADPVDKNTNSCGLSAMEVQPVTSSIVPVVGPVTSVWRGSIEIVGRFHGKVDGLELHMPQTISSKVVKVVRGMQPSLCFSMKKRDELWPKNFDDLGATRSDISLYVFRELSWSEADYDDLVEHMISHDLAMTSRIGSLEIIIFTSLEQELDLQKIQGKYYLWGFLKGKKFQGCKSPKVKSASTMKSKTKSCIGAANCGMKTNISLHTSLIGNTGFGPKEGTQRNMSSSVKIKRSRNNLPAPIAENKQRTNPMKMKTMLSLVRYDRLPFISLICTRPRSKKSRSSGLEGNGTSSLIQKVECSEVIQQCSSVPHALLNEKKTHDVPGLNPSLNHKEKSEAQEINSVTCGEKNPCSESESLGILPHSGIASHQSDVEDQVPNGCPVSTGSIQLTSVEYHLETLAESQPIQTSEVSPQLSEMKADYQASDLPEADSCRTPLLIPENLEEPISSENTTVLEFNDEEEDDTDMVTKSLMLTEVGRYRIKSSLAPILTKILDKYGDIALGCSITPEIALHDICKVCQELESVSLSSLRPHHIDRLRTICQFAEALQVDVKWLFKRCDDLEKLTLDLNQYRYLTKKLARCNRAVQSSEEKLNPVQREKLECEIKYVRSMFERFVSRSLAEGLY